MGENRLWRPIDTPIHCFVQYNRIILTTYNQLLSQNPRQTLVNVKPTKWMPRFFSSPPRADQVVYPFPRTTAATPVLMKEIIALHGGSPKRKVRKSIWSFRKLWNAMMILSRHGSCGINEAVLVNAELALLYKLVPASFPFLSFFRTAFRWLSTSS